MAIDSSEYVVDCCCKAIWQGNPLTFTGHLSGHGVLGGSNGQQTEIVTVTFKQVCVGKENGECPDKDWQIEAWLQAMRVDDGWSIFGGTGGGEDCTSPRCCKRKSRSAFLPTGKESDCCPPIQYHMSRTVGASGPAPWLRGVSPYFK